MGKKNRLTFVKESGFIFAMIGSAVGFANILAFGSQCYKNGGGAFLIPFLSANLIIGLPMLFLEGIIGKKYGLPISSVYSVILPNVWKSLGWIAALSCLTIGSFYSVLTAWSVAYTYFATLNIIPADTATFFNVTFLKDSGSLEAFNQISWPIFISAIFVGVFSWYVVSRDIGRGIEKVCSFFMPLLFILFLIFAVIVIFLPGSYQGFYQYLNPDFSRLQNFHLWRDVFGQVFFSYSLGIGIVVGYSRHTRKETNIKRAMIYVAIGDMIFSLIAGFVIFGSIGFMSQETGIPFHEIISSDSSFQMGFVIFPKILQTLPMWIKPIVGALFFFCIFIAGITGVFSIIESISGNIEVEFQINRKLAVTISSIIMGLMSFLFCFGNAVYIIGALSPMVLGYTFLLGGIAQIYVFMFLDKSTMHDPIWQNAQKKPGLLYFLAKYLGLAILFVSLIGSLYEEIKETFVLSHAVRWLWFSLILAVSIILAKKVHIKREQIIG